MNTEQKQAYEWAKSQDYQSVAARYAKTLAGLVDEMQAQLELEHGGALAAAENCLRLQGEVNDLQAQLAEARRRTERAIADIYHMGGCPNCIYNKGRHPDTGLPMCEKLKEFPDGQCFKWRGD